MNPLEILTAARALIAEPGAWTQGAYRRDAKGEWCKPPDAVCWCVRGALAESRSRRDIEWDSASLLFETANGIRNIEDFNDAPERTHADVLHAFDRAIAAAGAVG